ncbi:DNA-directed RNA polymerase subunit N [Candidatus Micrarchaeota archaeon]|nr:DNA-directed RNA polymerase subunit N [Candidatus Micrarchaeota archaeon]
MLIPVRCFTCGKPIGQLWEDYQKRLSSGQEPDKVLNSLGLKRYCCRRMMISNKDYIDDINKYRFK